MGNSTWLLDHAADTYSQSGEDGVLSATLATLPARDGWCVEFGAWDGVHLSNVRKLVLEQHYKAILIEGDPAKCGQILTNYSDHDCSDRVFPVCKTVGWGHSDGLDSILADHSIPTDFDLLSIDIDGNDYHVWQAVQTYRPKVVCIEFNPTIPTEVDFVQDRDPDVSQGSSLSAMYRLASEKGYEAVSVLPWNAVFVDGQYFKHFGITDNSAVSLRRDLSAVTWLFSGFDGSVHLTGDRMLPWHGLPLDERRIQQLPRFLRSYPDSYSAVQRLLLRLVRRARARSSGNGGRS